MRADVPSTAAAMEKSSVAFMRQPTQPFLVLMSAPDIFDNGSPTNGKIGALKTRKNLARRAAI
jgi:hypothetical protein